MNFKRQSDFVIHQGGADAEAEGEEEAKAQKEEAVGEKEDEDINENPDVLFEADFMRDQRILDDDDDDDDEDACSSKPAGKSEELKVVDPSSLKATFSGESENGWQIQNTYRQRKKLERIMIRELSKIDVMPDARAKLVGNVIIMGGKL